MAQAGDTPETCTRLSQFDVELFAQTMRDLGQKIETWIVGTVFQTADVRLLCTNSMSEFFLRDVLFFTRL